MRFNDICEKIFSRAEGIASEMQVKASVVHLLLAVTDSLDFRLTRILADEYSLDYDTLYDLVCAQVRDDSYAKKNEISHMCNFAMLKAGRRRQNDVDENVFVLAILTFPGSANDLLKEQDVDIDRLVSELDESELNKIDDLTNINEYVKNNPRILVGRQKELRQLQECLFKKEKPNALLIGEPGVGKSAIVYHLAHLINQNLVGLAEKTIYELDLTGLVAGTKYRGEFEEKVKNIIKKVVKDRNAILFIDEIHNIIAVGGSEGAIAASQILKPYLARGEIQCIGATTHDEYVEIFEKDKALDRRFQIIQINESTASETKEILTGLLPSFEDFHRVKCKKGIIDDVIHFSQQYLPTRYFPDKAIDILDYSFVLARLENKKTVTKKDVIQAIETICHVNVNPQLLSDSLKEFLNENIIGQQEAIDDIYWQIKWIEKGLSEQNKPLSIMMFTGPSGVGKSESAKLIATYKEQKLVKLDMSSFTDASSVSKLIGAAPGYIGFKSQTYLVDEVRKNPHCLILLDKIEKAHEEVVDVFLNIFDDGYLIDANKRKVDFSNAIFVLTTTNTIQNEELLNHVEKIIYFTSLDFLASKKIAVRYANESAKRLEYSLSEDEISALLENVDTTKLGARGIKKAILQAMKEKMSNSEILLN